MESQSQGQPCLLEMEVLRSLALGKNASKLNFVPYPQVGQGLVIPAVVPAHAIEQKHKEPGYPQNLAEQSL